MSDVVGTAYVRIKALTNDLAKDIKTDVTKALKNSDLDKVSKAEGEEIGENLGDGIGDGAEKTLKKRAKNIVPADDINDGFKNTLKGVRDQFEQLNIFDNVREKFDQLDLFEDADFDISIDTSDADNESRGLFSRLRAGFKDVGDQLRDDSELGKGLDGLSKKLKGLGSGSAPSIGLLGKSFVLLGGAVTAALPYIQDVGAAILAYGTGLVAQIGFLTTATVGLGAAAGAALGSVAVAGLPLLLAFKSETEALVDFKDGLKATGEEFLRIGTATQATLLPGLEKAAIKMEELVPMFSEFGLFVGSAVGNFAQFAAEILTGNEAQGRFQDILRSSLRILDILLPTLLNIGDLLSGIWVAALPAAEKFAGSIGRLVQNWADMVNVGLESGELTNTLSVWYDRAELILGALGNVSGALFDILSVGADSSDNVFVRFDQWAERFRNFTESEVGKNRIGLIFDNALAVMREVNGVAADLFDGIFGRLGDVGGVDSLVEGLQKFRLVLPGIQEQFQDLLATIREVTDGVASNVWDKLTLTWEEMEEPLGRLVHAVADFLNAMDESGSFEIFLKLMQVLTDVLSTLLAIPGFGTFVGYLLAFGSATKVATIALGPFLRVFGQFSSVLVTLIRLKVGGELSKTAGGITALVRGFRAAQDLKTGTAAITGATTALKGVGPAIGAAANTAKPGAAGFASVIGGVASGLSSLGPAAVPVGLAVAGIALVGATFLKNKHDAQKWDQEVRQITSSLGLLHGGLNITAEGISKYIEEQSRFEAHDQIDDLARLGFTIDDLGIAVATATTSYRDFAQLALDSTSADAANDLFISIKEGAGAAAESNLDEHIKTLNELQKTYKLTNDQVTELSKGNAVYVDGLTKAAEGESKYENKVKLVIEGNNSLLESFEELNKGIGEAAKDSVDSFVTASTNMELLSAQQLGAIKKNIDDASDEEAAQIMVKAQKDLQSAAAKQIPTFTTLSQVTRDQIKEQSRLADGTIDNVKQYELLRDALKRQNTEIRDNLALFDSAEFASEFGAAKDAVIDFNDALTYTSLVGGFDNLDTEKLSNLGETLPGVATATQNLFDQLRQLPEAEFNAAATALGTDADVLRGAMEGAQQAIIDLQNKALETLPSISELLDDAVQTKDDGSQFFDKNAFIDGVNQRLKDTTDFKNNIQKLLDAGHAEAARIAAQQGPEAAANLASMVGGDDVALETALSGLKTADEELRAFISETFGPGISAEFAAQAGLIGKSITGGLAQGVSDPATLAALQGSSMEVLDSLANTFHGRFIITGEELKFVWTGKRRRGINPEARGIFSEGGFVGGASYGSAFSGGPVGTDTVAAWLTPGEFVLRRAIAQAIPAKALNALNAGDPRMISLLTSNLRSNQSGTTGVLAVHTSAGGAAGGGVTNPLVIQQMNIQAPEPLESARMVTNRLKILQTQLTRR